MPNAANGQIGEVSPTNLQVLVWTWRDANPDGSQANMRRDLENAGVVIARGSVHSAFE